MGNNKHVSNNWFRIASAVLALTSILIISLLGVGCQTTQRARVVRLMPDNTQTKWCFDIKPKARYDVVNYCVLTNKLAELHLHHGDVILIATLRNQELNFDEEPYRSLLHYLDSRGVALYACSSSETAGFFLVPIYHWVAPFENPRNLDKTTFFREGKVLGTGMNGYVKMAHIIASDRTDNVFILGSLYDIYTSFGPHESPYERYQYILKDALRKSGTRLLVAGQLWVL